MASAGSVDEPERRPMHRTEYESLGRKGTFRLPRAAPDPETYRTGCPADASLVIEVSDASHARELGLKARLYAAAGVPDYWILDLARDEINVHREPAGGMFRSVTRHRTGAVRPLLHEDVVVDVADLLRGGCPRRPRERPVDERPDTAQAHRSGLPGGLC